MLLFEIKVLCEMYLLFEQYTDMSLNAETHIHISKRMDNWSLLRESLRTMETQFAA